MFDRIKKFFAYLSAYRNFNDTLLVFKRKILLDIEKQIAHLDNKRKSKMADDKLAKEMLLYDNCYIIPKDDLNEYISKG
jgi:hypothetical protein